MKKKLLLSTLLGCFILSGSFSKADIEFEVNGDSTVIGFPSNNGCINATINRGDGLKTNICDNFLESHISSRVDNFCTLQPTGKIECYHKYEDETATYHVVIDNPGEFNSLTLNWNITKLISFDGASSLHNLTIFNTDGDNKLTSLSDGVFQGAPYLSTLDLSNNEISNISKDTFLGLSNLTKLDLSDNLITNLTDYTFQNLPKLQELNISNNKISNISSESLQGLSSIQTLNLSKNEISSLEPNTFSGLTKLSNLQLYSNKITSIETGTFTPTINTIDLSYNQLTDIPSDILSFNTTRSIRINGSPSYPLSSYVLTLSGQSETQTINLIRNKIPFIKIYTNPDSTITSTNDLFERNGYTLSGYKYEIKNSSDSTVFSGNSYTQDGQGKYRKLFPSLSNGDYTLTVSLDPEPQHNNEYLKYTDTINFKYASDITPPTCEIKYTPSTSTTGSVKASLINCSETINMTSNYGKRDYTFTQNGSYTFKFEDSAGNEGEAQAVVDRIIDNTSGGTTTGSTNPSSEESKFKVSIELTGGCNGIVDFFSGGDLIPTFGQINYILVDSGTTIYPIGKNRIEVGLTGIVAYGVEGNSSGKYAFSGWNNNCGSGIITRDCTITAICIPYGGTTTGGTTTGGTTTGGGSYSGGGGSSSSTSTKSSGYSGGGTHGSASNNALSISVNNKTPYINERIKLTINTDDDYTGKIKFNKVQYKEDTDDSRSTISSRTSSTYFSDYAAARSDGYYKMLSSDDGEKTISKFLKIKKAGYYKIYAEDTYGESDYIIIEVGENNKDLAIQLSTNRKSPTSNQYVDLTIETEDVDYTGKLSFSAKYRRSSSSSRTNISDLTSSTYFSNYSYTWQDGYYKMKSSDEGEVTLKSLIKFKKEGYYRIYVKDTDDNEAYIQFSVDIDDEDEDNDNEDSENDEPIEDEIFIARNGKKYTIQYVPVLKIYTSKDLKKEEYFINTDYIKRYIDSKNPQKGSSNRGRIATSYLDKSDDEERFIAPNGKVYYITEKNGIYSSKQLSSGKSFSSIKQLKLFIRDHNPLIGM